MKKLTILAVLLFPFIAFAEVAATEVPGWLQFLMDLLVGIPVVGPILLEALKWLGVVSAVMTAVSTSLTLVAKALQVLGQALGFQQFAAKIEGIYNAIWPYLAWLSVYNSKKAKV